MKRYKIEIELWGGCPFEMEEFAENKQEAEKQALFHFWDQADCTVEVSEMAEGEKLSWQEEPTPNR